MQSIPLSLVLGRHYGKKIRAGNYDVIFAPIADTELAFLETSIPVCYLSDTTFIAQENYYYQSHEISALVRWQGNYLQRRTIQRADALIYTNDWATRSAIRDYDADPAKIRVFPFGANLVSVPDREILRNGSADGTCRLLFVSADWIRKRGQLAYDTMLALREMGINAELTVVGCTPSTQLHHPNLYVIPFLNKNIPTDLHRFEQLYLDADFFILPTRAECSANVFCEASAFGLPTISTDTGGVSTAVQEGVNGFLLLPEAGADAYAATIVGLWSDPVRYRQLRLTTRQRFESQLNWKVWAESVRDVMLGLVEDRKSAPVETPR